MLASVAGEVAVMTVDHGQAGAHVAGEIEGGNAGTEREGREGVSKIVDPAHRLDPGGTLCGLPLAVTEVGTLASLGGLTNRTRSVAPSVAPKAVSLPQRPTARSIKDSSLQRF